MPRRVIRSSQHDRRGATIVEFAIVAPVFFLIILALFEFCWINVVRHTADNAAYEAARTVMVPGATAQEGRDEVDRILRAVGARDARVTIDPANITTSTTHVTVRVEVPMDSNALLLPRFTDGLELRSQATLRTERVETR
jgi:Flp pilus assembly protein TadG